MHSTRPTSVALRSVIFSFVCTFLTITGCSYEKKADLPITQQQARSIAPWLKEGSVVRLELTRPTDGKTFERVGRRILDLQTAGFTIVWFSSISPTSSLYHQHEPTDPVPAQDFLSIEEDFGTLNDFKKLVRAIQSEGMKVIIDFVPKYTSWDSKLVMEHPDWFRTNDEGAIIAPNNEWTDVADLNYEHHELRKYMIDVLKFWTQEVGVDGFAFQKADLIPLDFWVRARTEVERVKPVVFLAQSNLPEHHLEAFDATYSNEGGIRGFERGEIPAALSALLENEAAAFPTGAARIRFSSVIHDYPQEEVSSFDNASTEKIQTVLAYTIPGIPVKVMNMQWLSSGSSSTSHDMQLTQKLSTLKREFLHSAESGIIERKLAEQTSFVAYERKSEHARLLVLLNYSKDRQPIMLQLPENFQGGFVDYLSGATLAPSSGRLEFTVNPLDAKILLRTTEGTSQ